MGVSLDGRIAGPGGGFAWAGPDEEIFRSHIDELRRVDVHLMGRRPYETMFFRETAGEEPSPDDDARMDRAGEPAAEGRLLHHAHRGAG
ncbi:hypothetical protein [Nonomuraea sp. NPDC049309]|uniref:hypothetical protein n=1 Tax=Nonomuraea sp. NPDC049309 TaxID=3364350 RepID=UPI00371B8375